jgi:hypothetical protein
MKYRMENYCIGLILKSVLILSVLSIGCKKSTNQDNKDRYYVKYEVNSTSIYSGGKLNVTIQDKDSIQTFIINTKSPWETVIGPVEKGFTATLGVIKSGSTDATLKLYAQISVSVNNEPFVLKKIDGSDVQRNSVNINYTIGN